MSLTRADREWIRKALKRHADEIRQYVDEAIREEAQLAVLQHMAHGHAEKPAS